MSSNTSAEALSQFLNSNPDGAATGGQLIDRLGKALTSVGDEGLPFVDAMSLAGLSRPEFLSVLGTATSAGLVQSFEEAGMQKLRLTPAGRSLY